MSKVLPATCIAQVVTTGPVVPTYQPMLPYPPRLPIPAAPLPGAIVLSQGIGPSVGIAVIDEDSAFYIANISPGLKLALDQIATALNQISSTLTSIGAGMAGSGTAPPPTLATDVAAIAAAVTALTTIKEALA